MQPYLSVVIAARNDSEQERAAIQSFVERWVSQAQRHKLCSELIVVGPGLAPSLHATATADHCRVRFLEAPAEIRTNAAKNAGIRSADGEFVLATSADVLFSDELVQRFSARDLEPGRLYRIDRYDVSGNVSSQATLSAQLDSCRANSVAVHAREGTFALTPDSLRRNMPEDIAPVDFGLSFGAGWFPSENIPGTGETFRWMRDNAEVQPRVPQGGGILVLEMEPGPGLGSPPRTVQIIDAQGARVAEWNIDTRVTVALAVPAAAPGRRQTFRLRFADAGRPVLDDDRILDAAVFRCDWAAPNPLVNEKSSLTASIQTHQPTLHRLLGARRQAEGTVSALVRGPVMIVRAARLLSRRGRDIFEGDMDFQLGPGWFHLEDAAGERFRWIGTGALFLLRMPRFTSRLALLLEPSARTLTFVARWQNENGKILARVPVSGFTYLEFTAPAAPGSIISLYFTCEQAVEPNGIDPRPLSFRIFACGAGSKRTVESAALECWPTLPLESKPVGKDWIAELASVRPQLAEMGRPEHLHTNAASDFLLMAREHWLDLRGFPEIDLAEQYADSLFCYAAHYCGIREEVWCDPLRIYRIGGDNEPRPVRTVQREDLMWLIVQMRSLHAPVIFNRDEWGSISGRT